MKNQGVCGVLKLQAGTWRTVLKNHVGAGARKPQGWGRGMVPENHRGAGIRKPQARGGEWSQRTTGVPVQENRG